MRNRTPRPTSESKILVLTCGCSVVNDDVVTQLRQHLTSTDASLNLDTPFEVIRPEESPDFMHLMIYGPIRRRRAFARRVASQQPVSHVVLMALQGCECKVPKSSFTLVPGPETNLRAHLWFAMDNAKRTIFSWYHGWSNRRPAIMAFMAVKAGLNLDFRQVTTPYVQNRLNSVGTRAYRTRVSA